MISTVDTRLPGDEFVNPLFNTVVLVTGGIVLVKSRQLACLICCIAIAIHLCSTRARDNALSTASWRTAPVVTVKPDDVYEYLMLSLVRWVASAIVAAFAIRLIAHQLTLSTLASMLLQYQKWFIILPVCGTVFIRGWSEFYSFKDVSNDWGLIFHFTTAQLMDTTRVALQVLLLFQTLSTATPREQHAVAHTFVFSALISVQNLLSYGLTLNFSWVDILIQLCLMKKTIWAYVSFVDFIGAVLSVPVSLLFPPYDDDYVTEDLAEVLSMTSWLEPWSEPPTTGSQEANTKDIISEPVQMETLPDVGFELVSGVHPHYIGLLLQSLQKHHGDFLDGDFLFKPLPSSDQQSHTIPKPYKDVPLDPPSLPLLEPYGGFFEEQEPLSTPFRTFHMHSPEPDSGVPDEGMHFATLSLAPLEETTHAHTPQQGQVPGTLPTTYPVLT